MKPSMAGKDTSTQRLILQQLHDLVVCLEGFLLTTWALERHWKLFHSLLQISTMKSHWLLWQIGKVKEQMHQRLF